MAQLGPPRGTDGPHRPALTLGLVDGLTSYLAQIVTAAVPAAHWRVGEHRIADYPLLNYPVLVADSHQIFLPALPIYSAYQSAHGRDPMSGTEMLTYTRHTITALRGEGPIAEAAEEPLVTVVAEVDCFDVGLRADISTQHPGLVERLITEFTDREGVASVYRYGPKALVVDAPGWDEIRLQLWFTLWLHRHLYTDGRAPPHPPLGMALRQAANRLLLTTSSPYNPRAACALPHTVAPASICAMEVTIAEAASRLGVSPRQAQRLAQQGQLQIVRRVGRTLIVEDTAITQRRQMGRGPGRRWNRSTAWAAIQLLEEGSTTRVADRTLFRLKRRLVDLSVEEFVRLAAGRAQTRRMTQTRRRPAALKEALILSGRSALENAQVAARFGLAGGDSEIIEGYLRRDELEAILTRFGLVADAEGEVFLHISDEAPVNSIITTALDLLERGTTRERSAAHAVLESVLDQWAL